MKKLSLFLLCLLYTLGIWYIPGISFANIQQINLISSDNIYDLLIIADNNFIGKADDKFNDLADYAKWKKDCCDISTKCVSIQSIGGIPGQNAVEIRKYIQEKYINNGVRYAFLVGDSDTIECKYEIVTHDYSYKIPDSTITGIICTDYLYSEMSETVIKLDSEISVGRLPVKNKDDLQKYLNKVKKHTEVGNSKKFLISSGNINDIKGNDTYSDYGEVIMQYSVDALKNNDYSITQNRCKTEIKDQLNNLMKKEKPSFVNLIFHGNSNNIKNKDSTEKYELKGYEFTNPQTNFIYSTACKANNYSEFKSHITKDEVDREHVTDAASGKCFGEEILFSPNSGCLAFIGNTAPGLGNDRSTLLYNTEFTKQINDSNNDTTIGDIFMNAKNVFAVLASVNDYYKWMHYSQNLLGDPSIKIHQNKSEAQQCPNPPRFLNYTPHSNDTKGLRLSWDKPQNINDPNGLIYRIYRDSSANIIAETKNLFYDDKSIFPCKTYRYVVKSVNSNGLESKSCIECSNKISIDTKGCDDNLPPDNPPEDPPEDTQEPAYPKPPQNLSYKITAGTPILMWKKPANYYELTGVKYRVLRTDITTNITEILINDWEYTTWSDVTTEECKYYRYSVMTTDSKGRISLASNEISIFLDSSNCKGKKEEKDEISKPSVPLDVTARYNGQGIILDWNPPASNGGSEIEIYYVYFNVDGGEKEFLGGFPGNQATLDIPQKGKRYCFKIVAKNIKGIGEPSSPPVCVETGKSDRPPKDGDDNKQTITKPDKPTELFFNYNPLYRNLTLNWSPPLNMDGTNKCTYEIQLVYISSGFKKDIEGLTKTTYTENNVIPGNTYVFKVRARNSAGFSSYAAMAYPVPIATNEATKPSPPLNLRIGVGEDYNLWKLVWDEPKDNGGSEIVHYEVSVSENGGMSWLGPFWTYDTSYIQVSPKLGYTYYFKVRAVNSEGKMSDYSITLPKTKEADEADLPPTAPSVYATYNPDSTSIMVSWSPSDNRGGAELLGYEIYAKKDDGEWKKKDELVVNTYYILHDVKPGSTYYFKIKAVDKSYVRSDFSNIVEIKLPEKKEEDKETKPLPPTNLNITFNNLTDLYTLVWDPSDTNGGSNIDKYIIFIQTRYPSGDIYEPWTDDNIVSNNEFKVSLARGFIFEFQVVAINMDNNASYYSKTFIYHLYTPTPPNNFQLNYKEGENTVTLTWEPPSYVGDYTIKGYYILEVIGGDIDTPGEFVGNVLSYEKTIDERKDEKHCFSVGLQVEELDYTIWETNAYCWFPEKDDDPEYGDGIPWNWGLTNKKTYWYGAAGSPYDGSKSKQPMDINVSRIGNSRYPRIVLDSFDLPHVAWADNTSGNYDIYYIHWDNEIKDWVCADGITYNSNNPISANISKNIGNSSSVLLLLDSLNNPHIVWQDSSYGSTQILYTFWDGNNWICASGDIFDSISGNGIISKNPGYSVFPSIILDEFNKPHFLWFNSYKNKNSLIYIRLHGDSFVSVNGTNYKSNINDSIIVQLEIEKIQESFRNYDKLLTLDSMGLPHICYSDSGEIYYIKWNGDNWISGYGQICNENIEYANISRNNGYSTSPSLTLDSSDNVHICWSDDCWSDKDESSCGNLEIVYCFWNGNNFVIENISKNKSSSWSPSIAIDKSNKTHISWHDFGAGNGDIYYIYDDQGSWRSVDGSKYSIDSSKANISNNRNVSWYSSLILDSKNSPHISWYDTNNNSSEIFYTTTNPNIGTNSINPSPQESKPMIKSNSAKTTPLTQAVKQVMDKTKSTLTGILQTIQIRCDFSLQ